MLREDWEPGTRAWFEYHCFESDESSDADLWHRSHQGVTVVRHDPTDHDCVRAEAPTMAIRGTEYAMPCMYIIRFIDGHEAGVFEDELMTDRADFFRPDPPPRP